MPQLAITFLLASFFDYSYETYLYTAAIPTRSEVLTLARKGRDAISIGDLRSGRAYLAAAIRLNPHDIGNAILDDERSPLPDSAIAAGKLEVDKLFRDRPVMAAYLGQKSFEPILEWIVRRMAGEDIGKVIKWNNGPLRRGRGRYMSSFHKFRGKRDEVGEIRLVPGNKVGSPTAEKTVFDRMWADLAFELGNAYVALDVERLAQQVYRGDICRTDAIEAFLTLDLHAAELARGFFVAKYLPFAIEQGIPINVHKWPLNDGTWGNARTLLTAPAKESERLWTHYGDFYESIRQPHRQEIGKEKKLSTDGYFYDVK